MSRRSISLATLEARCDHVGECWMWRGGTIGKTTPAGSLNGKRMSVRRAVWALLGNPAMQPGEVLSTTCGELRCVNPAHIRKTTKAAQMARRNKSGKGEAVRVARIAANKRKHAAKLDATTVARIRASDETGLALAAKLNVHHSLISAIRRGKTWRTASPLAMPWA